jgi:murein DD-endopeptidase MepM/ murein hydrolase activator NlpD
MRKQIIFLFIIVIFRLNNAFCQQTSIELVAGGDYRDLVQIKDEISPQQRISIVNLLQENETMLRAEGKLQRISNPTITAFKWPLKQALGYNDNGYYGISNYVDENPAFPNALLDYNCGTRTYDQASGYNHAGTDIFTWPFYWQKMERNIVQVIAAASGTIIAKSDGNFDQNCAFCTGACNWNAVYVMHTDGSVAWYGHMKSGSLTTKLVGQQVVSGEYLGVVGSSGNSTGPHLHFEVYTNSSYTQLVDPWAGTCNNLNGQTSWWANQQPYYVPTLNKIMTHGAAPAAGSCPAAEVSNEKINFANGDIVYLGSYYRDQLVGQQAVHTIYKPDNSIYSTWTQSFTTYYSASYWYYSFTLPNPATTGTWKYEIVYNGTQKQTAYFAVNSSYVVICPGNYNVLTSNLTGTTYQWQVNTGSGFTNIADNAEYAGTSSRQLQLKNISSSFYDYRFRCFVSGSVYSNEIILKFISYWTGAVSKAWEDPSNWTCGNIPDSNTDVVIQNSTNTPEVNSITNCRSTTVNPGTTITVKAGSKLDITH